MLLREDGVGGIVIATEYNSEIGIYTDTIRWDDGTTSHAQVGFYPAFASHYDAEAYFEGWL